MVTHGEAKDYGSTPYGTTTPYGAATEPVPGDLARPTVRASGFREDLREESVPALVGGMARDLGVLVRQEANLLRVELAEKVDVVKEGVASVATGALVTFCGGIFLILAAVLALDAVIDVPWLSALIVGGLVTLIGAGLLGRGRAKLSASSMIPERAARSLQKDVGLAKEEIRRTTT
jgi:hypothetical protein